MRLKDEELMVRVAGPLLSELQVGADEAGMPLRTFARKLWRDWAVEHAMARETGERGRSAA